MTGRSLLVHPSIEQHTTNSYLQQGSSQAAAGLTPHSASTRLPLHQSAALQAAGASAHTTPPYPACKHSPRRSAVGLGHARVHRIPQQPCMCAEGMAAPQSRCTPARQRCSCVTMRQPSSTAACGWSSFSSTDVLQLRVVQASSYLRDCVKTCETALVCRLRTGFELL